MPGEEREGTQGLADLVDLIGHVDVIGHVDLIGQLLLSKRTVILSDQSGQSHLIGGAIGGFRLQTHEHGE